MKKAIPADGREGQGHSLRFLYEKLTSLRRMGGLRVERKVPLTCAVEEHFEEVSEAVITVSNL